MDDAIDCGRAIPMRSRRATPARSVSAVPDGVDDAHRGKAMPRILLVEDNETNRDMLSRRLRRRGFDVLMARDGQQGIELAEIESPDLILMDMSLPLLDGWEATKRLKAAPETRSIPIIALTAHAMAGDR